MMRLLKTFRGTSWKSAINEGLSIQVQENSVVSISFMILLSKD